MDKNTFTLRQLIDALQAAEAACNSADQVEVLAEYDSGCIIFNDIIKVHVAENGGVLLVGKEKEGKGSINLTEEEERDIHEFRHADDLAADR